MLNVRNLTMADIIGVARSVGAPHPLPEQREETKVCPECDGAGEVEALRVRWPFARMPEDDVVYTTRHTCEVCKGLGEVENA